MVEPTAPADWITPEMQARADRLARLPFPSRKAAAVEFRPSTFIVLAIGAVAAVVELPVLMIAALAMDYLL